jgi:hypothetical protein
MASIMAGLALGDRQKFEKFDGKFEELKKGNDMLKQRMEEFKRHLENETCERQRLKEMAGEIRQSLRRKSHDRER